MAFSTSSKIVWHWAYNSLFLVINALNALSDLILFFEESRVIFVISLKTSTDLLM